MGFHPISIEKFIASYKQLNPSEDIKVLRESLAIALKSYQDGDMCHCGSPIWVIGSAIVSHACYTCITGEAVPDEDYEIEEALIGW